MPMGKGTYGSKKGRPAKKSGLTAKHNQLEKEKAMYGKKKPMKKTNGGLTKKQKTLPASLKKKIMASKKKK